MQQIISLLLLTLLRSELFFFCFLSVARCFQGGGVSAFDFAEEEERFCLFFPACNEYDKKYELAREGVNASQPGVDAFL